MYKKILIPLNESELAEHELEHGLHIAADGGGIVLLTVASTLPLVSFPSEALTSEMIQEQFQLEEKRCRQYLQRQARGLRRRRRDLKVEVLVARGQVTEVIAQTAEELGVDLLILAQSQKSTLEKLLMGSTTKALLERLEIPALIVHGPPPTRVYRARARNIEALERVSALSQ